jgi:hypothetical protein
VKKEEDQLRRPPLFLPHPPPNAPPLVLIPVEKNRLQQRRRDLRQHYWQFGHTRFEWIQLVATLAVPIAIGIFTVMNSFQQMNQSKSQFDVQLKIAGENRKKDLAIADENRKKDLLIAELQVRIANDNRQNDIRIANETRQNDLNIAAENRRKDIEIAAGNRLKDLKIAEVQIRIAADNRQNDIRIAKETYSNEQQIAAENRRKDIEIASENRLKDFKIAEENRLKDFAVTEDQQKHQIVTDYETFLTELLLKEGIHLNNTNNKEAAQFVARFKTLVVFRQLDPKRRSRLFKSLYEGRLAGRLDEEMIIDLASADLSDIDFASQRNVIVLTPP